MRRAETVITKENIFDVAVASNSWNMLEC